MIVQPNSDPKRQASPGQVTFSVLVSAVLVVVPIYLYVVGTAQTGDDRLFFEAIFFWFLGMAFLLSTKYASKVFALYAIYYASSKFAVAGGKYLPYFYGVLLLTVGSIQALRWLGLIEWPR